MSVIEETKELLSESGFRIKLHDFVAARVQEVITLTAENQFPILDKWLDQEFIERLKKYEAITFDLCQIQALLAYWGTETNNVTLAHPIRQISGNIKPASGIMTWIGLRWYPTLLLMYTGGIAAVAAGKYDNLRTILKLNVPDSEPSRAGMTLVKGISKALGDLGDAFKFVPGHEREYTPRSEYFFELLRPIMDDLFFLGMEYESHFDRFEVLLGLEHTEQFASEELGGGWGPVGRFGWKFKRGDLSSPLHLVIAEGESQGDLWPPIKAGFFKGSAKQFEEIASKYRQKIAQLVWQ
jgi:hypothetical protein